MKQRLKTKIENDVEKILKPGDLHVTDKPVVIKTLLGSCLSFILYNKRTKLAAISHAQLPYEFFKHKCTENCPVKCNAKTKADIRSKYVTCSTRYMLQQFYASGIKKNEIDVKIFGGANVLGFSSKQKTVGDKNIDAAYEMIKENGLNLVSEDVGGEQGRTIYLYADSGTVLVRKHDKSK